MLDPGPAVRPVTSYLTRLRWTPVLDTDLGAGLWFWSGITMGDENSVFGLKYFFFFNTNTIDYEMATSSPAAVPFVLSHTSSLFFPLPSHTSSKV